MASQIEISKHLMLVNSASSVFRKILSLGVLVWLQQYLVRRISAEEYQLLPILTALIIFFPLLSTMFVSGVRRYVTDAYAKGDEEKVTRLVSTMLPLLAGIAVLFLAIGGTCAWFIDSILDIKPKFVGQAQLMFGLLIFGASMRVALGPLGLGFDLRQRFLLRNLIGLGVELFRTVVLLALLLVSTKVLWVVVASTAGTLLELLIATRTSMKLVPALRFRRGSYEKGAARPLLSFGSWSVLSQGSFMIREAADPLILNRMSDAIAVASFHIGSLVDRHVRATFLQSTSAVLPVITAMNATGQIERLQRAYLRICRYSLWALAFLAAPLIVFREELFGLYLREKATVYTDAPLVMALLMARVIVIYPNSALGMLAAAKAEIRPIALRGAVISASNLALTFYLVGPRNMGAVGAALATFLVTIVGAPLLNWTLGMRLTGTRLGEWLKTTLLPGITPLLFALPVWLVLQEVLAPDRWLRLALGLVGGAVVYVVALYFFAMRSDERQEIRRYVKRLAER